MKIITYEWVVEQTDEHGDIYDTSGFDTLEEAQRAATLCDDSLVSVICLRRDVGEGEDREHLDIDDRQYAYPGDRQFEYGATIPKHLLTKLDALQVTA